MNEGLPVPAFRRVNTGTFAGDVQVYSSTTEVAKIEVCPVTKYMATAVIVMI